jgi:hypothetical protein
VGNHYVVIAVILWYIRNASIQIIGDARRVKGRYLMKNIATRDTTTEHVVAQTMAEALRETDLTTEEVEELRARVETPRVLPTRQPRDLPTMDPSLIRP